MMLTLGQIKAAGPCGVERDSTTGFRRLLLSLGQDVGRWDPDTAVSLGDVARSNCAADAWWCIRVLDWTDVALRRAVVAVLLRAVRRASAHTTDTRVHDCIAAVQRWCDGDDSVDLLAAAEAAYAARVADAAYASDAAYAAAYAAYAAADAAADAAYAARAADAAYASDAAAEAAYAARVAYASDAAAEAAYAARVAYASDASDADAEHDAQVADLIAAFPPLHPAAG